jgi:hypothetical protein
MRTSRCSALALAAVALGACAKSDETWTRDLASEEPFARFLAGLALADDPARAKEALPALFEGTRAGVPREGQAARAAIKKIAARDLSALVDYRLTAGRDDPAARQILTNVMRTADAGAMDTLLDGLRQPDRGELDDLRGHVVDLARRERDALRRLADRVASAESATQRRFADLLYRVGPAALPDIERIRPRVDLAALGFDLARIGEAGAQRNDEGER